MACRGHAQLPPNNLKHPPASSADTSADRLGAAPRKHRSVSRPILTRRASHPTATLLQAVRTPFRRAIPRPAVRSKRAAAAAACGRGPNWRPAGQPPLDLDDRGRAPSRLTSSHRSEPCSTHRPVEPGRARRAESRLEEERGGGAAARGASSPAAVIGLADRDGGARPDLSDPLLAGAVHTARDDTVRGDATLERTVSGWRPACQARWSSGRCGVPWCGSTPAALASERRPAPATRPRRRSGCWSR